MLSFFNTLSKKIEPFSLETNRPVRLYTCGPTVYNNAHIGNLRSYLAADILQRTLKHTGLTVEWVMNITDIDDKTIRGTIEAHGSRATADDLRTYTSAYTELFFADLEKVGIHPSNISITPISTLIPQMGIFIRDLILKGFAYSTEAGDVYFSIEKYNDQFGDYGQLVGEKFLEGKKTGARVANDEYDKENLSDFALWKAHNPESDGNIFWEVEGLAPGRPGWHIECSVLNSQAFGGNSTDIHTGGVDLIFPHHTNEIAQSQPFYRPFSRFWCHSEHLLVDGKKMAKSLGNFITVSDIEARHINPLAFRYLMLTSHYQTRPNFTWEALQAADVALRTLAKKIQELGATSDETPVSQVATQFIQKFTSALCDNLNTAVALSVVWEVLKSELSTQDKSACLNIFNNVLGFDFSGESFSSSQSLPEDVQAHVQKLIDERHEKRMQKKFAEADALRTDIETLLKPYNHTIADTEDGSTVIL